jgi:very-short-patch-repair endonuclease
MKKQRHRQTESQTELARELRARGTIPERILWNVLKNRQVAGLKFRRQVPIGEYVVDYLCAESSLIVELDGISHEGRQGYDAARTEFLQSLGYTMFRVTNDDVLDDAEAVAVGIARAAGVDVVAWLNGRSRSEDGKAEGEDPSP